MERKKNVFIATPPADSTTGSAPPDLTPSNNCVTRDSYYNGDTLTTCERCCCSGDIKISTMVDTIGIEAFKYCRSLTGVEFPTSLLTIGRGAFQYCSLTGVDFSTSRLTSIGDSAFKFTSLPRVVFPTSLMSIGPYAFQHSDSISSIVLPSSLTAIGYQAFGSFTSAPCDSPSTTLFVSPSIPESVYSRHVLYGCTVIKQ